VPEYGRRAAYSRSRTHLAAGFQPSHFVIRVGAAQQVAVDRRQARLGRRLDRGRAILFRVWFLRGTGFPGSFCRALTLVPSCCYRLKALAQLTLAPSKVTHKVVQHFTA
jgi:hypothetical protein